MSASADRIEALCREIRRAVRELAAAGDTALVPLGLQTGDRTLLLLLARETEPISLSALARKASVSRQHIHQSLRRLPDSSWVEQVINAQDRRSLRLRLSRRGRAMWRRIRAVDSAFFGALAPAFDARELDIALRVLARLSAHVAAPDEER